jgi:hypothetical protein
MEKDPAKVKAGSLGGLARARNYRAKSAATIDNFVKSERARAELLRRESETITAFLNELEAGETP